MEQQMTYAQMLGMAETNQAQQQAQQDPLQASGMSGVMDPAAGQLMSQIQVPAATPQELENRKAGWTTLMEKLSDPNLQRSLGFAGAAMMMPGATAGHGMMAGLSAFQAGEYAEREQARGDELLKMKKAESEASVASTQQATANAAARQPSIEAAATLDTETLNARIQTIKNELEKSTLALNEAKGEADVAKLERGLRERLAKIKAEIPDEQQRKAITAEIEAALLKVPEARARLKASQATTTAKESETAVNNITLDVLKGMPKDEQAQFLTKTGKYSNTTGSAIMQQANMWGAIYDKLPATDPQKKGKTREQFQMTQLQSTKAKDVTDMMKNYVLAGGDDPQILAQFSDILKGQLENRASTKPGAPDPTAGTKKWTTDGAPAGFERMQVRPGEWTYRRVQSKADGAQNSEVQAP